MLKLTLTLLFIYLWCF